MGVSILLCLATPFLEHILFLSWRLYRTARRANILRSEVISHQYDKDSFSVPSHALPTLMHYEIVARSPSISLFNHKFNPREFFSIRLT